MKRWDVTKGSEGASRRARRAHRDVSPGEVSGPTGETIPVRHTHARARPVHYRIRNRPIPEVPRKRGNKRE